MDQLTIDREGTEQYRKVTGENVNSGIAQKFILHNVSEQVQQAKPVGDSQPIAK